MSTETSPRVVAPGPELDALMAMEVMGWTRVESLWGQSGSFGWESEGVAVRWRSPFAGWSPSDDDGCAMRVVDRMRELGWRFSLDTTVHGAWAATFYRGMVYQTGPAPWQEAHIRRAPTRPLAVALAALRALGHDVVLADDAR